MLDNNYSHPYTHPTSWLPRLHIFEVDPQLGDPYAHIPKGGAAVNPLGEPGVRASGFEGHVIEVTQEYAVLGESVCFALIELAIARVLKHHGDDIADEGVPLQMLMERFVRDNDLMGVDVPASLLHRSALWARVFGASVRYCAQRMLSAPKVFERQSL